MPTNIGTAIGANNGVYTANLCSSGFEVLPSNPTLVLHQATHEIEKAHHGGVEECLIGKPNRVSREYERRKWVPRLVHLHQE